MTVHASYILWVQNLAHCVKLEFKGKAFQQQIEFKSFAEAGASKYIFPGVVK